MSFGLVWLVWFGFDLIVVIIVGVCLFVCFGVFFSSFPNTLSCLPVLELHWRS